MFIIKMNTTSILLFIYSHSIIINIIIIIAHIIYQNLFHEMNK